MVARRLILLAVLLGCLALSSSVWAGTLQFTGDNFTGQGLLNFNPGAGAQLTISGAGGLITDFLNTANICSGDCMLNAGSGSLTLTTGTELSQTFFPGGVIYTFNPGGSIQVVGGITSLGIPNGTILFSAKFIAGSGITFFGDSGSFQGGINLASIYLNPLLGTYHFLGGHDNEFAININDGTCILGGLCTGQISQSTLQLTIPEPATLSVLGVGLFAVGTGLRRKMVAKPVA